MVANEDQFLPRYKMVKNQALIVAEGDVFSRTDGRAYKRDSFRYYNQTWSQTKNKIERQNPGWQLRNNAPALRLIENETNNIFQWYDNLILEYTPTRNGAQDSFYVNYNTIDAVEKNEFLFVSKFGNNIFGDKTSQITRASNRSDGRGHRNLRPIKHRFPGGKMRMVVVADRDISTTEFLVL